MMVQRSVVKFYIITDDGGVQHALFQRFTMLKERTRDVSQARCHTLAPLHWQHIQQEVQHTPEMMGDASQTWWDHVKKGFRRMKLSTSQGGGQQLQCFIRHQRYFLSDEDVHYGAKHHISGPLGQKDWHLLHEHKLKVPGENQQ